MTILPFFFSGVPGPGPAPAFSGQWKAPQRRLVLPSAPQRAGGGGRGPGAGGRRRRRRVSSGNSGRRPRVGAPEPGRRFAQSPGQSARPEALRARRARYLLDGGPPSPPKGHCDPASAPSSSRFPLLFWRAVGGFRGRREGSGGRREAQLEEKGAGPGGTPLAPSAHPSSGRTTAGAHDGPGAPPSPKKGVGPYRSSLEPLFKSLP